jgi:hypothetical protein
MRVMVLVKATRKSEAGGSADERFRSEEFQKALADMGRFNEELAKAGVLTALGGLHPGRAGKRVRFGAGKRTVTDGPFAETKELVAGFWLWQVKSIEEAVEWVRRCPDPMPGEGIRDRNPPGLRGRGPRSPHPRAPRPAGPAADGDGPPSGLAATRGRLRARRSRSRRSLTGLASPEGNL